MRRLLLTTTVVLTLCASSFTSAKAQQVKTAAQCNADYSANKTAIKAAKLKKRDFVASCRAGNEVIPGATATAPAPVAPAPVPVQTAAPAPAASSFNPFARKPAVPAPAVSGNPVGAYQFATEAQAEGRCRGATIVWVNTKSGVYHFSGTRNYGNTKAGAYMCEADAAAAGDRASKTEKHP